MAKTKVCKHDWIIERGYHVEVNGEYSSVMRCSKCEIAMTAREVIGYELWKHTVGVQKYIAIGSLLISLTAIVITLVK